jgi:hypothetical protein
MSNETSASAPYQEARSSVSRSQSGTPQPAASSAEEAKARLHRAAGILARAAIRAASQKRERGDGPACEAGA